MNRSCLFPQSSRFIIGLLILLVMLSSQTSIGKALSSASDTLVPLEKVVIQSNEIEFPFLIPVTMNQGMNATYEMGERCGIDCIKWFWGGTNSLSITMSRTNSEEAAQRAVQNVHEQFQGYREAFSGFQVTECIECGSPISSWQFRRGKGSDDIVLVSTHGSVWIMMVLHVEANLDNLDIFVRDYCQGEQCWQSDVESYSLFVFELTRLQHRKLALNGYAPIGQNLAPINTFAPKPTVIIPPPNGLHYLDFLSYSPVCILPCINNLEPGKSTTKDIPPFFQRLGMVISEPLPSSGKGMYCMDLSGIPGGIYYPYPPELCVFWKDDLVLYITLDNWNHPELFQMSRIARVLGVPEKIFALTYHGLGVGGSPNYSVALYYPQKFLMLETQGYSQGSNKRNVCFSDRRKQTTRIIIYSNDSAEEALGRFFNPDSSWNEWNEALDIPLPDLFILMQDPKRCIPYWK